MIRRSCNPTLISSSGIRLPRGERCRLAEVLINGRSEYVVLEGTDTEMELRRRGAASSPSKPPTSKKDMRRGVRTDVSRGLGGSSSREACRFFRSVSSVSTEARRGLFSNVQLAWAGVIEADGEPRESTVGAGRATLGLSLENSGPSRMPRSPTKSSSLPQLMAALVRLAAVVGRSRALAPPVLPNLNRCFFTPRSRMNEPRTTALETAVAARISIDASSERYCWFDCRWIVPYIR